MLRNIKYIILLISALAGSFASIQAQYSLLVDAGYIMGFNTKKIVVHHDEVHHNFAHGYQLNISNRYRLKESNLELTNKMGMKSIYSTGHTHDTDFDTETYKFVLTLGALYHINPTIAVGLSFGMENNLDFEYFRTQTSDLFRYSIQPEFEYAFSKRWSATFQYFATLTPLASHYLITNPQHQVQVGLRFKVL